MKHLFFIGCAVFFMSTAQSQVYETAYNREFDEYSEMCRFFSESGEVLAWDASDAMESMLVMYEVTGDLIHLSRFTHLARAIMASRIDNPLNMSDPGDFWGGHPESPNLGTSHSGWPRQQPPQQQPPQQQGSANCNCLSFVQDAKIIVPMTRFVRLIKSTPSIAGLTPATVSFSCTTTKFSNRNNILFGTGSTVTAFDVTSMTYDQIANYLKDRCVETISDWGTHWDPVDGYNIDLIEGGTNINGEENPDCNGIYDHSLQLNAEALMGSALLNLIQYVPSLANDYAQKIQFIAGYFKAQCVGSVYVWDYYTHHPYSSSNEDISHGGLDLDFVFDYIEIAPLVPAIAGNQHFNQTHLEYFQNTFMTNIAYAASKYHWAVNGTDFNCEPCGAGPGTDENKKSLKQVDLHRYIPLKVENKAIVHRVENFIMDFALYSKFHFNYTDPNDDYLYDFTAVQISNSNGTTTYSYYTSKSAVLYALANCAKYNNYFNPVATYRKASDHSEWRGIVGGNIDGTGQEEIVAIREYDNKLYLMTTGIDLSTSNTTIIDYDPGSMPGASIVFDLSPYGSDWAGVACGNFTNAYPGDEIAVVNNSNGSIHVLRFDQNLGKVVHLAVDNSPSPGSDWRGIAAADVDGDNIDEIGLVRNYHKNIFILKLNGSNNIVPKAVNELQLTAGQDYAGIASGDFDNNGYEEFVVVCNGPNPGFQTIDFNIGTSTMYVSASNFSPGVGSDWVAIAGGDFSGTGHDEFLAYRNKDGAIYQYTRDALSGNIVSNRLAGGEIFPINDQNSTLGAIHTMLNPSCPDFLLLSRNSDGHIFLYSLFDEIDYYCSHSVPQHGGRKSQQNTSNELAKEDVIQIYPNPVDNQMTIIGLSKEDIVSIEIYDVSGRKMAVDYNNNKVFTGGLTPGTYLIHIATTQQDFIEKFVKY